MKFKAFSQPTNASCMLLAAFMIACASKGGRSSGSSSGSNGGFGLNADYALAEDCVISIRESKISLDCNVNSSYPWVAASSTVELAEPSEDLTSDCEYGWGIDYYEKWSRTGELIENEVPLGNVVSAVGSLGEDSLNGTITYRVTIPRREELREDSTYVSERFAELDCTLTATIAANKKNAPTGELAAGQFKSMAGSWTGTMTVTVNCDTLESSEEPQCALIPKSRQMVQFAAEIEPQRADVSVWEDGLSPLDASRWTVTDELGYIRVEGDKFLKTFEEL
ncbi:MAG: hypothetical protein IV100_28525 [Myxococcales bacterium]|nr:hypothetical protein [Myxococcales bacterium]